MRKATVMYGRIHGSRINVSRSVVMSNRLLRTSWLISDCLPWLHERLRCGMECECNGKKSGTLYVAMYCCCDPSS
jgi:hypothetical protein